jgi:hypothetical protein
MIYIAAFANNQELKLKQGKKYIVHFPKDSLTTGTRMNLFYGTTDNTINVNWKIDSMTILKPTAYMSGWITEGWLKKDTTKTGFYFKGSDKDSIYDYFYKHFDNSKLQSKNEMVNKLYEAKFIVNKEGNITEVKISEIDSAGKNLTSKIDPYLYEYLKTIPPLEPFYQLIDENEFEPINSHCSFFISMGFYPPDYRSNERYNQLFKEKYNSFENKNITSMNDAELQYYVFSASKLGWINCDFFWDIQDKKIDYIVKVDPKSKPDVKLIFKKARSIMPGIVDGDKCVFKNVPTNQDVKIVSISYRGSKPLLAVSETKTNTTVFDKFDYQEFSIKNLDSSLNLQ